MDRTTIHVSMNPGDRARLDYLIGYLEVVEGKGDVSSIGAATRWAIRVAYHRLRKATERRLARQKEGDEPCK